MKFLSVLIFSGAPPGAGIVDWPDEITYIYTAVGRDFLLPDCRTEF